MEVKLKLSTQEHKDLVAYCNLNDLLISSVVKDSFTTGFNIERYGLLNAESKNTEKVVEKKVEVIKYVEVPTEVVKYVEVPVEIIKEVEVIKEIEKEVIREVPIEIIKEKVLNVIKEVPIEKVVEKIIKVSDDTQINELLLKIQQLENTPPKVVEVIKEVPVDKVVTQEKIVEVPVEIIKEVIVEKESQGVDKSKFDALQQTVMKLRQETLDKDRLIKEYEKTIQEIQNFQGKTGASFLKGSNLDDKLYK